jgi:hypothetical protein
MPSKETNESQKQVETRKLSCNATVRRLACSVAWELIFLVSTSCVAIALSFPQFALLNSIAGVQLSLTTFLGNCGCVAVATFLGVPSSK